MNVSWPNVSYNCCETSTKEIKLCYMWTMKEFSCLKKAPGEYVKSSTFSPIDDQKNGWWIKLYPRGNRGVQYDFVEYVSIFLIHVPDSAATSIEVDFEFSILNKKQEKCQVVREKNKTFKHGERSCGLPKYIGRDVLMNGNSGFLKNDELTVLCEVVIRKVHPAILFFTEPEKNCQPICVKASGSGVGDSLGKLLESKHLSDVVLVVGNKQLHVHKLILAARSEVFRAMFDHDMAENRQNKVAITDIKYETLEHLIRFIYTGKIPHMTSEMAKSLLIAADKYSLQDLKLMCEQVLISIELTRENIADLVRLASYHNADRLKERIIQFMTSHAKSDVVNRIWDEVISNQPEIVATAFEKFK